MMDISLPLAGSDDGSKSESDTSKGHNSEKNDRDGSSKFVLFPIVSSVLDSKAHALGATAITLATVAVTSQLGSSPALVVAAAMGVYSLGVSAFEFGERAEIHGEEMDEYPFLIAMSGLSIPVTMTMGYLLVGGTSPFISATIAGIAVLGTWMMNRRLYVTMKEDVTEHGYVTSNSWLFVSRVPFVGALTLVVYMNPPALLWVGLLGLSTAASFAYGIIRIMEPEPTTPESTWEEEWNPSTTTQPDEQTQSANEQSSTSNTSSKDPMDMPNDEPVTLSSEEGMSESPSPTESDEPEKLLDNYEKAKELTNGLKDAVEALNSELDREGLTKYKVPKVSGNTIPPEVDKAKDIHKTTKELNEYLLDYDEDNKDLRRHVLEVQQHIQEIDEFIYTDIDAPEYR